MSTKNEISGSANLKAQKVLCYVRPWNTKQFEEIGNYAFPGCSIIKCSEHKSTDCSGLSRSYYKNIQSIRSATAPVLQDLLDETEIDDVIKRCRLLRNLPRKKAETHLCAMYTAAESVLDQHNPDIFLSLTVDSFVIDALRLACKKKSVPFLGLVPTFINGYFRISARGEKTINPSWGHEIVEDIRRTLSNENYVPDFNIKAVSKPRRKIISHWSKNFLRPIYFFAKRLLSGDFYNYHYWTSQRKGFQNSTILPQSLSTDNNWDIKAAQSEKPAIYVPLQKFPECTIDYWMHDANLINYEEMLFDFIEKHKQSFNIVIKEHPTVYGDRPRGFYRRLSLYNDIIKVPPWENSHAVLRKVSAILVWTGSAGYEAAARDKIVLTLTWPYYAIGPAFKQIDPDHSSEGLRLLITEAGETLSKEDTNLMMEHLASQLFPGSFKNDGTWSENIEDDQLQAKKMGEAIKNFMDSQIQK